MERDNVLHQALREGAQKQAPDNPLKQETLVFQGFLAEWKKYHQEQFQDFMTKYMPEDKITILENPQVVYIGPHREPPSPPDAA